MGRKGSIAIGLGVLLIAAALCLTIYNIWDDARAGAEVEEALTSLGEQIGEPPDNPEMVPDYVLNPNMTPHVIMKDGIAYLGTIYFPTIDRELPVLNDWSYPNLKIGPCCYTGTIYQKNMVIAGHNYRKHFGPLRRMAIGDPVVFTDADGYEFHYTIGEMEVLDPYALEDMTLADWDLTIFTCTLGGQTRFTVRCMMDEQQ